MLNAKTLGILSAITLAAVLAAVLANRPAPSPTQEAAGQALFPDLLEQINKVTEIIITTPEEGEFHVERDAERWAVTERGGYPASSDAVQKVLLGVAQLTMIEPKTHNPEFYAKLNVEDVQGAEAKSLLVQLRGDDGETLASLIVGKPRPGKIDPSTRELYVRKPDDPQSWLVAGNLMVDRSPQDWLDKKLLDLDATRIRQVNVTHEDDASLVIAKDNPEQTDYRILDLAENAKIKSAPTVNSIATTLAGLLLEDVRPESEVDVATPPLLTVQLDTFDGLQLRMETHEKDDKTIARFSAAVSQASNQKDAQEKETAEETDTTDTTPERNVEQEAAVLNERFKGWAFVVPPYELTRIAKRQEDLIETKDESEAKDTPAEEE